VAVADRLVSTSQRELAQTLLSACGEVAWVDEEDLINAVTALSGGGPAYVFLLIEAMAEAGRKAGLPADLAMRLARVTVSGAGELARLSPESAAQLRQNVTSPKGTTLEALTILMAPEGIQPLFDRAIAAATRRSRELAN
jgi:pyrroline-5-carboxylate reductase